MKDYKDKFIAEHHRSMSLQDMADRLGVNKSTVSRRLSAMRESGEVENSTSADNDGLTKQARERLQSCTMSRADRLAALSELKDMLHAELALAGGQGFARVSSEYRATLEQMEAISAEISVTSGEAAALDVAEVSDLKSALTDKWQEVDAANVIGIADDVLTWLNSIGALNYTPLDMITSTAETMTGR